MTHVVEQNIHTKSQDLQQKNNKPLTLIEATYQKNIESDYTEKIADLGRSFNYDNDRDRYWSEPQFSLLYGTPIFESASRAQRLVLNHLYWTILYSGTASSEANTILYNTITAGVFEAVGGYETLCREIDRETEQEKEHIRAFQTVSCNTNIALLGAKGLNQFLHQKLPNIGDRSNLTKKKKINVNGNSYRSVVFQENVIRLLVRRILNKQEQFYSHYFRELEQKGRRIVVPTSGWNKRFLSDRLTYFLTLNYGSSPFLASCFYLPRFMANTLLKIQEHRHALYFRQLEKQGEDIPVATAISHYHCLDEAFHITISQTIARDLYKEFPNPTAYEKLIANIMAYQLQRMVNSTMGIASGIHGDYFGNDSLFMLFIYKLLQTPIFAMSAKEALYWIEKSCCYEHEGLHQTLKYHKSLGASLRRCANGLDYLWPVNREMHLLDAKMLVEKAVKSNIQTFENFSKSVTL